jgi:hypothetical protein
MIGEILEHYRVIELVGRGGMGAVYRAVDINLDRTVAVKVLNTDLQNDPEFVERFRHEARVQAALNHPNIATLFDFFIRNGAPVAVMEFIEGETLQSMIKRRGPVPAHVSLPIFKQALQGVAAGHRRKIIHRDLKPANLMIDPEGNVKVTDFGIAKLQNSTGLTLVSTRIGTSYYMAPEQILGRNVDARTDIYAMGITLYEMLSGQTPFRATTQYEIENAHVNQVPPPPTIHYPHIPPAAVDAVLRALAKEPAQRFASAEEFMQALPELNGVPYVGKSVAAPAVATVLRAGPAPGVQPLQSGPVQAGAQEPQPAARPEPANAAPSSRPSELQQPRAAIGAAGGKSPAASQRQEPRPPSPYDAAIKKKVAWIGGGAFALILVAGAITKLVGGSNTPVRTASLAGATTGLSLGGNRSSDMPRLGPTLTLQPQKPNAPSDDPESPGTAVPPEAEQPPATQPPTNHSGSATPPPPPSRPNSAPLAARDLSGQWAAVYADASGRARPRVVLLQIDPAAGAGAGAAGTLQYKGTLRYQTDTGSVDECLLDGSTYTVGNKRLRLLVHCRNPRHPVYFNSPLDFIGVDPRANALNGGRLEYAGQGISVSLKRMKSNT